VKRHNFCNILYSKGPRLPQIVKIKKGLKQGDQIGRIVNYWAIDFLITDVDRIFGILFSTESYVLKTSRATPWTDVYIIGFVMFYFTSNPSLQCALKKLLCYM
jgi:hypothetical protein